MDEKKLAKLKNLLDAANEDYASYEQVVQLFKMLSEAVQEAKKSLEQEVEQGNKDNAARCMQMLREIEAELGVLEPLKTEYRDAIEEAKSINSSTIAQIRQRTVEGLTSLFERMQLEGKFGKLVQGYEQKVKELNQKIADIPEINIEAITEAARTTLSPEQLRDSLETLEEDERLDAAAIKNLPEHTKTIVSGMNKVLALYMLMDVDVAGIATGQSIKWDGIRWIPYTPVGGNTAVYNEAPSGSGTSWTLANTPVSGTLRVYANGQRLIPTTDYSLSGTTITTVLSWAASTITCDYEY